MDNGSFLMIGAGIFAIGLLLGKWIAKPIEVSNFGCCEGACGYCDDDDSDDGDDEFDFDNEPEPMPHEYAK